ncbi:hypothetical protein SKAU_G00219570 [Synaphobranchus kaupii]|uniref:FHOD1 N-terminal GTPase-binding domain-containing protein n=1 Tax=Synaphobranchus kaupii TaxID=118154 RepID=A0A9Q1ITQ4_SYNKA|nr:hypothetical protein SKAU_G00219570 [Synaphobranchus kaupii]
MLSGYKVTGDVVSALQLDDCALQLSHNGTYLDLESTLAEQRDELEGFQEDGGRGKKHSIVLRTQLSVRVHACIAFYQTGLQLGSSVWSGSGVRPGSLNGEQLRPTSSQ